MLRYLQGAGGHSGSGGSHSHNSDYSGGGGGGSLSTGATIGLLVGAITCLLFFSFLSFFYLPKRKAAVAGDPTANVAPGNYVGCYRQYNRLHGVPEFKLSINHSTNKVKGRGTDDVGKYILLGEMAGKYVSLTKTYIPGTGNRRENKGHTVFMKLAYEKIPDTLTTPGLPQLLTQNGVRNRPLYWFSGTWQVATRKYVGNGKTYFWQTQQQEQEQQQGAQEASAVVELVAIATPIDEPKTNNDRMKLNE